MIINNHRAEGVQVESGGEVFNVYGDEIILSSGSIGSPQLLMLSGIGPAAHLEELGIDVLLDLPGVGKNLRDHPNVWIDWNVKEKYLDVQDKIEPFSQMALRYTATGSDLENDMCVLMASKNRDIRGIIRMIGVINLALSEGSIRLASSNPNQQPILNYNFLDHPEDKRRLRETVRICVELGENAKFSEIVDKLRSPDLTILNDDKLLDDWMMRTVTTGHHIAGTCKMGSSSDDMAVVDQFANIYGIQGLRVVDASIMPDCPRANTNVTTIMIAERISDFIKNSK